MTLLTNYNYATQQSLTPAFTRTKCVIRLEPGVAERKTEIKRNKPRTATNSKQIKERKRKKEKKKEKKEETTCGTTNRNTITITTQEGKKEIEGKKI